MFKLICKKTNCQNKDVVYYMPNASNPSICGGCKSDLTPQLMNQEEYDAVFDYDPFAEIPMEGI